VLELEHFLFATTGFATDQIDRILVNVAEQADEIKKQYQTLLADAQAISASKSELIEIQGYLGHYHAEQQRLGDRNGILVNENQRLKDELGECNEKLCILQNNQNIFDRALAAIQQNPPHESFRSLEESVQKLTEDVIREFATENNELRETNSSLREELNAARPEFQEVNTILIATQEINSSLREELNAARSEFQEVNSLLIATQEINSSLRADVDAQSELTKLNAATEQSLERLRDSNQQLQEMNSSLREDVNTAQSEITKLSGVLSATEESLEKLRDSNEQLQESNSSLREDLNTAQSELTKLNAVLSATEESREELRQSNEQLRECNSILRKDLNGAQLEITKLNEVLSSTEESGEKLRESNVHLTNKLKQAENALRRSQENCESVVKSNDNLTDRITDADQNIASLESVNALLSQQLAQAEENICVVSRLLGSAELLLEREQETKEELVQMHTEDVQGLLIQLRNESARRQISVTESQNESAGHQIAVRTESQQSVKTPAAPARRRMFVSTSIPESVRFESPDIAPPARRLFVSSSPNPERDSPEIAARRMFVSPIPESVRFDSPEIPEGQSASRSPTSTRVTPFGSRLSISPLTCTSKRARSVTPSASRIPQLKRTKSRTHTPPPEHEYIPDARRKISLRIGNVFFSGVTWDPADNEEFVMAWKQEVEFKKVPRVPQVVFPYTR